MKRFPSRPCGAASALALAFLSGAVGCSGTVDAGGTPSGTGSTTGAGNSTGSGSTSGTGSSKGTGSVTGTGSNGSGGTPGTGSVSGTGNNSGSGGTGTTAGDPNAAGVRPLRLLTNREYRNTVRDLFNDTSIVASALPSEDEDPASSFQFHAPGTVATLDATLYREAAEAIAKGAVTKLNTLLPCAASATTAAAETTCLDTFNTTLGMKMYRRPLAAEDVTRIKDILNTGKTTLALTFSNAIGFVIEVVLQSPEFLYHWEVDPATKVTPGTVVQLGAYEIANRMSYFLWGTLPDDMLFTAAKNGQLSDATSVETQVRRMLKDTKAGSTMGDFFTDWLDLDQLATKPKDTTIYPMYNEALTTAMVGEVQSFVNAIMVNGTGRFDELMTGTSSFANQALASLYGITGVTGTALKAVTLPTAQRSGLLTMAGFLSMTGAANGSDPPRRGKAILYKVLCRELPPPPANVPDPKPASPGVTTRQRFEEHSQNPCATACHALLDPLGFAFENYDGIGQYRTTDNNLAVNASVTLTLDGKTQTLADARALSTTLANSDEAQSCFTKQWFRYALGRLESTADLASVNSTATTFKSASRDVRELIVGLATSRTFRFRTPAAGEGLQ